MLCSLRDILIANLQQQLDDMTLFLEEERLNHKDTKKKVSKYNFLLFNYFLELL